MKIFHVLLKLIRRLPTEGYDARLNLLLITMLLTLLVSSFDLIGSDPLSCCCCCGNVPTFKQVVSTETTSRKVRPLIDTVS